jgi:hypothetical protein
VIDSIEKDGITFSNNIAISQLEIVNTKFKEIQSLESDRENRRIYAIDCFGCISILNEKFENIDSIKNESIKLGSNGWAGIKVNPINKSEFCGALFFDKSFSIYNEKGFVRKINCIGIKKKKTSNNAKQKTKNLIFSQEILQL